jgi:hypothetical protein
MSKTQLDDDNADVDGGALPSPCWEHRLSELADYRKAHRHCNVPQIYNENAKLGRWVKTQRTQYRLHLGGNRSQMTLPRIQKLERLGFEWGSYGAAWGGRLSELTDYRKINGHCDVPKDYSEDSKLANWVSTQRLDYRLHKKGKQSPMTTFRIQALESLGFEWNMHGEDRLSELAEYHRIHGHCNVSNRYSESIG